MGFPYSLDSVTGVGSGQDIGPDLWLKISKAIFFWMKLQFRLGEIKRYMFGERQMRKIALIYSQISSFSFRYNKDYDVGLHNE